MIRIAAAAVLVVAAIAPASIAPASIAPAKAGALQVARDVYLMGTRARLTTFAATRESGLATLESALQVLEDAEQELSTWRADSDISRLNRHPIGQPWQATPRVCRMLADVFEWSEATGGAFDPGIGRLLDAWDVHGNGAIPNASTLLRARAASGLSVLSFDRGRCTVTRRAEATLDVGAFGKGEALDRVQAVLGGDAWMIDLGGQVSVGGTRPDGDAWTVDVAHPLDRTRPHLRVRMGTGSLSTSGGSERDLLVGGARIAHQLDPRTGRPAAFSGSVTVWHARGLLADILSTALYVMGPGAGLEWADARGLAAAYLVPEDGRVRLVATRAFAPLIAPE